MIYLVVAVVVLLGYGLFCRWLIFGRGEFRVVYNPIIAKFFRWRGMQAITLGPTCYLFSPEAVLSPSGFLHERFHFEAQQSKHPYTFFPRYVLLLLIDGYDQHPDEQEARKAAGEPLR